MLPALSLPILLIGVAVVCDLRRREVPDWIPIALVVWALIAKATALTPLSWQMMVGGVLLGLVLAAPLFYMGGIGGGDVKLIAAIGALVGIPGLFILLFWMAISGFVLALIAKLRGQDTLAYVPAIAIGLVIYSFWPGALTHVLFG